jgi:hypothetical protein
VRRDDDVVELDQRPAVRLLREDVERRSGQLAALQRLDERVLVDELAARGVDEARPVDHARDHLRVDDPARLGTERQVERDELRVGERRLHRLGALDAELAEALLRDERVVRDHAHPEPGGAARDLLADPAEAEDGERLVRELDPAPARALPAAVLQRGVRLRDVPGERDEEPDRVLRGRDDGRLGRIATTIPRRVAAATSTLSTPTPARPITFRLSARSMTSAVSFVAERITIAS